MYNPFIPFTDAILRQTLSEGAYLFVIQRFNWPLVEKGKGFMVTAYRDTDEAYAHASQLEASEGKLLDSRTQLDKIQALVAKGSGYRLFLGKFRETNWNSRMMKLYRDRIIAYLRFRTPFKARENIDITFRLEYGRVQATIANGERFLTVPAADLIS